MSLTSSSSCLSRPGATSRSGWRNSALLVIAATLVLYLAVATYAIDPTRKMSQYIHDAWGSERNFPGGQVYAIAQTTDGYLWMGTENGLVRFDGIEFRLFQHADNPQLPAGPVYELIADSYGNLWIKSPVPPIVRYHDGVFEQVLPDLGITQSMITAMCREKNGDVLLWSQKEGFFTYRNGSFARLSPTAGLPGFIVLSIVEGSDGKIWMATRDSGLFTLIDDKISMVVKEPDQRKLNCLLPIDDRQLLVGTDAGAMLWDGKTLAKRELSAVIDRSQVLSMIRDRDSNIWLGTSSGIFRMSPDGAVSAYQAGGASTASAVDQVSALFEDREGNIWWGGPGGLQRLRDSIFTTYSIPEGMPSDSNGPVYVDYNNRVWFAPVQGGLYCLDGGRVQPVTEAGLAHDVIYSITGRRTDLWIGRRAGGLTHLYVKDGQRASETFTRANGLAQDNVYSVYEGSDGTVWAGTLSGGVSKYSGGRFTTYTKDNGLASNTVSFILEASDGTMWFGTPGGLNVLTREGFRLYTDRDGLPSSTVDCLFQDSAGAIWIGTANGIAVLDGGKIHVPVVPPALHDEIIGIAADAVGALWIATAKHVLRIDRDRLFHGKVDDPDIREYGIADGLQGLECVKRQQAVVSDALGRIWFSMNRGLSVISAGRQMQSALAPLVGIQAISADGTSIDVNGQPVIPPGHNRIIFSYSGLSLAMPERTRFRYLLEGLDRSWSNPVSSREAAYTNLAPGHYRFRVIACNSDGVWNSQEAAIGFDVLPSFSQTIYFQLLCLAAAGLVIFALYRIRLFQIARQMNVRFEERLAERTLIAQELHDTLLQGFLSASMQLHVASAKLPVDSPAKPAVDRVLQLMAQVIEEGRKAVRGLRSTGDGTLELGKAFARVQDEVGASDQIAFQVVVEGRPAPLHPIIRDEVYRIGREALVNAFRHSRAESIELEIDYSPSELRILVRDDGCGIDPHVLQLGREGHWGLPGMRERAERIESRLRVLSRAGSGTEVELTVPGHVAFQDFSPTRGFLPRIARLFSKKPAATPGPKERGGS